jgi:hypothetical protein
MGAAPGIQLGIGPESADTETTLVCPQGIVCLHLREISQPLSSTAVRTELPATCGPSPTCVSISGWLATATSDAGVRRAAIRRTGCCPAAGALTSAMFSAICTWTAFCKLCVQSVPRAARLLRPV